MVNYGVLLKPITHNSTVATYRGWQQKALYDLNNGRYIALGLANEEGDFIDFNITPRRQKTSPSKHYARMVFVKQP